MDFCRPQLTENAVNFTTFESGGTRKSGSIPATLLKLNRILIRFKLDCGFIYSKARKSYLKIFNPAYHEVLSMAIKEFRSSTEST